MNRCAESLNADVESRHANGVEGTEPVLDAHVVTLVNFIPPHLTPVLQILQRRVRKLTVLASTRMESNRPWNTSWENLDVRLQRSVTLRRFWLHPNGFRDITYIHIPRDTGRLLKQLNPDLIVSNEMGVRTLQSVWFKKRHPDIPLIVGAGMTDYTEQGRGRVRERMRRWILRHADFAAVTGESGVRYLQRLGFDANRTWVVPYTAEPSALYRGTVERDERMARRMLFVGQLIERKGILPFTRALIDHARRHPERRIEFAIAGDGPERNSLEQLQAPDNLKLDVLGQQTFDQVRKLYSQSGVFVFPTLADEWGLVVNEAMAAGLPVLGSLYGQSVEQLCRDDATGWTFRPNNPSEMDDAIDRVLSTPIERLAEMRVAARRAVENITPEMAADQYIRLFRRALHLENG